MTSIVSTARCGCAGAPWASLTVSRTDFALLESNLELVMSQLARVPTRAYLCRTLLLATASVWALFGALLLLRYRRRRAPARGGS